MSKQRTERDAHEGGDNRGIRRQQQTRQAARRRVLGILGAGGSVALLPEAWHKPFVRSLVLPAHAQTSPAGGEPGPGQTLSFSDPCGVSLSFEPIQVGVGGCTGGQATSVIPTVSGAVIGDGDLSGIVLDVESVLTGGNLPDQSIGDSVTTDADGNYQIVMDGFQAFGPHIVCTQDCATNFPTGATVQVTVTSTDSRLAGQQAVCMTGFACDSDVFAGA